MIGFLLLSAVATVTPTPSPTAIPSPTATPAAAGLSDTYGKKMPSQFHQLESGYGEPEATPTLPPNPLAGVAARLKLHSNDGKPIRVVDIRPSQPLPETNPNWRPGPDEPEYISDVHAQPAGNDGMLVYVTMATASTALTRGTGTLTMTIRQDDILYQFKKEIEPSDFETLHLGIGAFKHDATGFSTGRISFALFQSWPTDGTCTVDTVFTRPDGKRLTGSGSLYLHPGPKPLR
jgi:hypothetical protein